MSILHPSRLLYEDEHLLAVNKLSRELAVAGKGKMEKLPLLDFLKETHGSSLKPIHRLDFETSGVMLFAKSKACFENAVTNKMFFDEKTVKKSYRAIVMGSIKQEVGDIRVPLTARASRDLVPALTRYRVIERFGDTSFVEAEISSGKFHQVRRHFAAIGHPLVCDEDHGNQKFNRAFFKTFRYRHLFLHAERIDFIHFVTREPLSIIAPLPDAFERALKALRTKR